MEQTEPLPRGTQLGRFVVMGLVGRGGMGEVYVAHDPELDRNVAIKLLRAQPNDAGATDGRARLMREAQAIAKVSHPNVIVVYDVGTFEGRVFIAMEFVEGNTLGYWLQAQPRTLAQVLEVFIAAGRGLAAAHEKELVHRDFKPDNVMVGADGQVRVMDFGLARVAIDRMRVPGEATPMPGPVIPWPSDGDSLSTRVLGSLASLRPAGMTLPIDIIDNLTRAGAIVGTPAYMSPEQFRGEAADARTDQFSFCVALYEALYGERPFPGSSVSELTASVLAGRVRDEPAEPRVPATVRRVLLRGLNVEPGARFPSMSVLLAELQREPTLTGTRSFAAGAAAKLIGVWEAPDGERGQETASKAEIRKAFLATGKAYAAAAYEGTSRILDRFVRRWAELYVDACEATHLRGEQSTEVLDLRMGALGEALEDLRALCRAFRQATADTVENAVNAANALGNLERCADVKLLRAIVRPPEDPATRAAVEALRVRLADVRALLRVGRVIEGLKAALPLEVDARHTGYAPLLAEVLFTAGMLLFYASDIEAAARTIEEAAWTAELCRHDEAAAEATASLIFITGHVQSRFDAGEIWSRHAETVLGRMGGHELIRGWLFNNRGAMRYTQGRLRDAVEDMHRAIAAKESALGAADPDVAVSIANVAVYFDDLGETAQAVEFSRRAVRIMEESLGFDHPKSATALAVYADHLNHLGRFEEAREPAERALALFERETDPDGVYVTYPLVALGLSHIGGGRFQEAVPLLERAVRIREAKESVPARLADVHFALARALWGAGRDQARARALAVRAQEEYRRAPTTPATMRELAAIERWLFARDDGAVPAPQTAAAS